MSDLNFKVGEHEGLIQTLVDSMGRIEGRLASIEQTLAEKKGERRVALWALGTLSGAVGAFLTAAIKAFLGKHGS